MLQAGKMCHDAPCLVQDKRFTITPTWMPAGGSRCYVRLHEAGQNSELRKPLAEPRPCSASSQLRVPEG